MGFCIRCSAFNCNNSVGLISVSVSPNSSVRPVDDDSCVVGGGSNQYISGPGVVNVQFVSYAFGPGEDKWLDSRCKGSAQAGQTNIQRYDFTTDKWWFIPTKVHRAQINGVIGPSVNGNPAKISLGQTFFMGSAASSQSQNGTSITTEESVEIGAIFNYSGFPVPITVPDLTAWRVDLGQGQVLNNGFINSVNVSVDYPSPATITYSFDFPIDQ